jgi:hypothetical protein
MSRHFIAMGGEYGCMPDNCQAYYSPEDAVDGLNNIYELSEQQLVELTDNWITYLAREQGGAYCEISDCDCDEPWSHSEYDGPENWEEEEEEEEEVDTQS